MKLSTFAGVLVGAIVSLQGEVQAQNVDSNGCLRLLGSVACPGFSFAYINPSNLSNAFPFFENVNDVASFDVNALNYFSDVHQFKTTKFINQLSCYNASSAVIRWERTVLCSKWVNERWSAQCLSKYNGSAAATSQKMVCQSTCNEFAENEKSIVSGGPYCPGPDESNGNRTYQLNKDYTDCTNWTTLATNETSSCVQGMANEGNCGFGTSTSQLCNFCSGDKPEDCCYQSNTDVSVCGYTLPSQSADSPGATGTSNSGNSSVGHHHLSGGAIAGIVVGSVVAGILILGLILFLFCRKRRPNHRDSASSFGNGGGRFGSMFGAHPRSSQAPHNSSEKGLLGTSQSAAANSSPTMGGESMSNSASGSGGGKGGEALGVGAATGAVAGAGVGAGAVGLGMAGRQDQPGPGERSSGIVLPRVRDENQDGDKFIETGAEVNVLWPYRASLPDELDLRPGMKLRVMRLYDDAWGTAQVISGQGEGSDIGKQGAFPIVCVSEGTSIGSAMSNNGTSSLGSH